MYAANELNATDGFNSELPNKRIFGVCDGLMMLARACRFKSSARYEKEKYFEIPGKQNSLFPKGPVIK